MSDELIKPIEDLAAQGAEQPQPDAAAPAETAPSGGDGSQGLELPASPDASKELGEGAPATEGNETPVSEPAAAPAKDESADESAISPEPSEAPAAPLAAPTDDKPADAPSAETTQETEAAGAELLGSEGEGSAPIATDAPAQGDDKSSSEPLDEAKAEPDADAAPAELAPADEPKTVEQVTATGIPDVQPIFGGASDPSPAPDLQGQEELPHPALQGHGQGFISGTTMSTQSALPVPGDATAAAVAAQAIDKAQGVPDLPKADDAAASADDKAAANVDAAQGEADKAVDSTAAATDDAPSVETPAVPTAAHAPEAFVDLNDDGSAALDEIDESEAEVLRLELRGLANLALAIIKRLEKIGEKGAVGGHLESIQTSAQQVVTNSLNIFEVDEDDLTGFDSVSADIILDDLC